MFPPKIPFGMKVIVKQLFVNSDYKSLRFGVTIRDNCNNWQLSVYRMK